MKRIFCLGILLILLNACTSYKPPTEFAPNGEIILQALTMQVKQTQNKLSTELELPAPDLGISKVKVTQIDPIYIDKLAAYHLTGTYTLKLKQSTKSIVQKDSVFELFLQRQIEGKTWRLLLKSLTSNDPEQWSSYLVR